MTTNGFPLEALAQLETLAENVEEHEEFTKRAADMVANLEGDDMKAEMDAAKAMAKIEKAIVKSGPDEKIAKKLNKLAKTHSGTKVATRAKTLADLILS
jgi:predicted ArsR family transcriptional regulator